MDINKQKARNYSYFVRSYCQSFHYQSTTKENKLECTPKMVISVFNKKLFTLKTRTYFCQEHLENYKEKMLEFIKSVENYRKCNDLELDQVENMNETLLFLNMARTKTIAK